VQSEGTAAEQYGSVSGTPLQSYADVVEDVDVLVVMVVVVVVVVEVVVVVVLVTVVTVVVCVVVVVVDVVSIHASQTTGHNLLRSPNTLNSQSCGLMSKQTLLSYSPLQVTSRGSSVVGVVGLVVVAGASHERHLTGQRSLTSPSSQLPSEQSAGSRTWVSWQSCGWYFVVVVVVVGLRVVAVVVVVELVVSCSRHMQGQYIWARLCFSESASWHTARGMIVPHTPA